MSPEIVTTGENYWRFELKPLEGEDPEARRGPIGNKILEARDLMFLGRFTEAGDCLRSTGMPEDMAGDLVEAARNGIKGVRVTFRVVFGEKQTDGSLPRETCDFQIENNT